MERIFRYYAAVVAVAVGAAVVALQKLGVQEDSVTISHMYMALGTVFVSLIIGGSTSIRDSSNITLASLTALIVVFFVFPAGTNERLVELFGGAFGACFIFVFVKEPETVPWRVLGCLVTEVVTIWFGLSNLSNPWAAFLIALTGIAVMGAVSFLSLRRNKEGASSAA